MTSPVLIAPVPIGSHGDRSDDRRGDADFEVRWAEWQSRGRRHDRDLRRRLLMLAPVVAVGAAGIYLFLIR